jgi:putative transposase
MSETHHRQSYRLRHHSYSETRAYHITICSHNRDTIFGDVTHATVILSPIGKIIDEEIRKTPTVRSEVIVDTYVVMPNHVHLILTDDSNAMAPREFEPPQAGTISSVINGLKAACTSRVRKEIGPPGIVIWQGRFYDRVIRDDEELQRTRQYIIDNPAQWEDDHENPKNYNANL